MLRSEMNVSRKSLSQVIEFERNSELRVEAVVSASSSYPWTLNYRSHLVGPYPMPGSNGYPLFESRTSAAQCVSAGRLS